METRYFRDALFKRAIRQIESQLWLYKEEHGSYTTKGCGYANGNGPVGRYGNGPSVQASESIIYLGNVVLVHDEGAQVSDFNNPGRYMRKRREAASEILDVAEIADNLIVSYCTFDEGDKLLPRETRAAMKSIFSEFNRSQMNYVCAVGVKIEDMVNLVLPRRVVRLTSGQDRVRFINVNLSLLSFLSLSYVVTYVALIEPTAWIKHQRCMFIEATT